MAKILIFSTFAIILLCSSLSSATTVYTVGDRSGWDISTDLDSWKQDKTFHVGDTLLFQYSQYYSVNEVIKENYDGCNTTNFIQSSSNGNSSFVLSNPGDRYFVCGNRLYCLGGMKLHVNVSPESEAASPILAPEAQPGGNLTPDSSDNLPTGSSRSSNPSSDSCFHNQVVFNNLVVVFFGWLVTLFGVMHI